MSKGSGHRNKAATEMPREGERFARAALDGLSAHIAIVNEKGVIVAVNKAWRDFAKKNGPLGGRVCEQANYLKVCDLARGDDRAVARAFAQAIRGVLAGGRKRFEAVYPCHSPEEQRWFIGRVSRLPGKGPPHAIVAHENITARKKAEEALERSENELRRSAASLAEAQTLARVGSWRVEFKDGAEIWSGSDELARIWGRPPGFPITMQTGTGRIHPEDRARTAELWAAALRAGGPTDWEHRIVVEGRVKWIHVRLHVRRDARGRPVEISGTNQDITERRLAREALQKSEERHRLLLENSGLGIGYWDLQGRLILFNKMAARYMGGTPSDFTGRPIEEMYGPQLGALFMARFGETIQSQGVREYEDHVALPTGAKWFHSVYSRVCNSQGEVEGVRVISMDITERKQAEEKAANQQAAIAHLSRVVTMGELAAGIAHEINQPLGASLLYAETCRDLLQTGVMEAAAMAAALRGLIGQLERARATVARLKKFLRQQPLSYAKVDVNQVLTEAAELLAYEIKQAGVSLMFELSPRPALVVADGVLIQQAVINLVVNALEAMAGSGERPRRLTLGACAGVDGSCTVSVGDTGPGVGPAIAGRLFESFVTSKAEGMGLGLAISRSIVEQHEGRIWHEAGAEGGAWFKFTLPAAPPGQKGAVP